MTFKIWMVPAGGLVVAAVTSGCSGASDASSPSTHGPGGALASPGTTAVAVLDQKDLKFSPEKVTVRAGEAVTFSNSESVIHNVRVAGEDISGKMKRNDTITWVFAEPGIYRLTCDYHPQMKGEITVE